MNNFLLIFTCLLAGYLLKYLAIAPKNAHEGINFFIIYVALPALTLLYIPHFDFNWLSVLPILTSFVVFGAGFLFFFLLQKQFAWQKQTTACLILCCGLGNTSFLGFPLIEAYYGQEGLKAAILVDQGSFLVLASLGLATAITYSEGKISRTQILKKIVLYPQFLAFVLALFFVGKDFYEPVQSVLSKISASLVPLALFSVGFQLRFDFKSIQKRFLAIGLFYKLFLAPLLIAFLYFLLHQKSVMVSATIMEAAMPPMITASILATQYKLNPPLAQLLTGIGIGLAFLTTWLWSFFI